MDFDISHPNQNEVSFINPSSTAWRGRHKKEIKSTHTFPTMDVVAPVVEIKDPEVKKYKSYFKKQPTDMASNLKEDISLDEFEKVIKNQNKSNVDLFGEKKVRNINVNEIEENENENEGNEGNSNSRNKKHFINDVKDDLANWIQPGMKSKGKKKKVEKMVFDNSSSKQKDNKKSNIANNNDWNDAD